MGFNLNRRLATVAKDLREAQVSEVNAKNAAIEYEKLADGATMYQGIGRMYRLSTKAKVLEKVKRKRAEAKENCEKHAKLLARLKSDITDKQNDFDQFLLAHLVEND